MLKRINRITSRKEFEKVKKEGVFKQYLYFGLISLNVFDSKEKSFPEKENVDERNVKFGFVISKKISKKAVFRNKIRRKLAEMVKEKMNEFENGFRGIFLVKKNIIDEKGNIKDFKIL